METKETYLKMVYKQLQGPSKEKRAFLQGLSGDIDSFIDQNPTATYSDIEKLFGSPRELGQAFINCSEPHKAKRLLYKKRRVFFIFVIIAIISAWIIIGFLAVDYVEWKRFSNGYYVETIIRTEDRTDLPEIPDESTAIWVYK